MLECLRSHLSANGFARAQAEEMRDAVGAPAVGGWEDYARSWNDLAPDRFMADGGRYRRRRYGIFEAAPGRLVRQPHQPHYQSRDYNSLNGGVERWFEPITAPVAASPVTERVVDLCLGVFGALRPDPGYPWRLEMHQFRIEARPGEAGQPTPEGAHRDGVDWVLVMLVARENIAAGVTNIFDPQGRSLGAFTLTRPMDAVFIDDARVFHGVTAVEPADPTRPAHRDVLVATFRRS